MIKKLKQLNKHLNWKKILIATYIILALVIVYHAYYAKRIVRGVKIGSVRVGGLTYDKALEKLKNTENSLDKRIIFKYQDKTFEITTEKIGFVYDWNSSVARAFEVGRTKNIFIDTKDKLAGLVKSIYITPFYDYEDKVLENELLLVKGEVSKVPTDAHFVLDDKGTVSIVDAVEGYRISEDSLKKVVIYAFDKFAYGEKDLPVYKVTPSISRQDLELRQDFVTKIVGKSFVVNYKNKNWKLSKKQMIELISFKKEKDILDVSLNPITFDSFVELLKQEVDILPRGQVTEVDGNRVVKFEITQEGLELDSKRFSEDFRRALFGDVLSVDIPTTVVSDLNKDKYGIYSLLGEGVSKYTGSGTARINNLSLAAKRTNGVLVPPNGIYSMNKSIGEINSANGYDTAYVIKEGRTVLGEGGGVCQTSTTLFRAALNSGLPIVMRYPHDYRVSYYEIDSPVGLDASIYQPSLDFQFKNDTPNYILVQAEPHPDEFTLIFKIYGTPDGRSVTLTEPVVTNVSAAPAPLYQDDPTLPKGVVKQVDFAAGGASVSFTRTVKREEKVISEATFNSRYSPWRAIYLVGTKE